MKKLIYFLAVMVVWFSIVGCGGGGGNIFSYNAGDLIEEFGDNGIVEYGDNSKRYRVQDSAIDDEDNIYVVGYLDDGSNKAFIYKFNKDGDIVLQKELKESFQNELKYFCVVFNNGSLYVGGKTNVAPNSKRAVVAKYDKNLNLDTNFGNNGYATFGLNHSISSLAIANNKIYAGGQESVGGYRAVLHRLNLNGSLDINYVDPANGVISSTNATAVYKIIPLNNLAIFAAIYRVGHGVGIKRYLMNGAQDNTYNYYTVMSGFSDMILKDNKFYLVGAIAIMGDFYAKIRRINSNTGQNDFSFGNNGEIRINEGGLWMAKALSFDSDDNLLVSYSIYENSIYNLKLIKYDINGDIDTTFANNGKVEISDFHPINSHIDSDGNLIIVGDKKVVSNQHIIKLAKIHL